MLVLHKLRMNNGDLQVYISVQIMPSYSWEVKLCDKPLNCQSQLLCSTSEFLCTEADVV